MRAWFSLNNARIGSRSKLCTAFLDGTSTWLISSLGSNTGPDLVTAGSQSWPKKLTW